MNPATNPATNPAIDTLHALRDNWAAGGDMGRPDGFVAVREGVDGGGDDGEAFGGEAYAVKIELWTDDCLMDLKKQDEAAARRRGEALAKKWAKEHWPHTGYVDLGGAEGVYGATWAWDKATENELERTDPDEVVRLPAARANPEDDTVEKLKEWGAPEAVAEKIAEVVEKVGTCTDAKAMTGQCMDVSARLARELNGMTYVDDYGYAQTVRAFSTQLWDVPKRLQSNTLAHGHYVVKVETDSGVLWIDLTAAQFGERGPGVVAGPRVPAVGDFEPFWEGRSNPPSRKPLDKDLYEAVKEEAKRKFDVWPSAYASGWVVKTYKARGGRYAGGAGGGARGLTKWFGESWVDLSRPIHDEDGELVGYEPCGRKASDDPAAYPKCRPLKEAMRMSPSEVKDAIKRKRAAEAKAGRGGRGGRGARAPVRVSTYRKNPDAGTIKHLRELRGALARVAQSVYAKWDVSDELDGDPEVGFGGVCHLIADKMVSLLWDKGFQATTVSSTHAVHVYVVLQAADGVFLVDIPPHVYETGGGYHWKKIADVVFTADDVVVEQLSHDPKEMSVFVDEWEDDDDDADLRANPSSDRHQKTSYFGMKVVSSSYYPLFSDRGDYGQELPAEEVVYTTQDKVSSELVQSYIDKIRAGERPAVTLGEQITKSGATRLWVFDGHHRLVAYRTEGLPAPTYRYKPGVSVGGPWGAPTYVKKRSGRKP